MYPAIKFAKTILFNVIIIKKKKDNGNPMDTSCVEMYTCGTLSVFNNTHSPNEIYHY